MARTHRLVAARADGAAIGAAAPLRVAVVDMGSNAIRFHAAEVVPGRRPTVLRAERRAVRLGHGVFLSGRLASAAMDAATDAMVAFAATMTELGIRHSRAVATSAVREAANGEEFLARVKAESGLDLVPISGAEEARLVHLAVRQLVDLSDGEWLIADLGGGSVEVSLADKTGLRWSESHTIGSVRLLEELSRAGEEPGRFRQLLGEYISNLRLPSLIRNGEVRGFVATGGNIEALARLSVDASGKEVTTLPLSRLRATIDTLAKMSYRQRVEELGLREDRADVVLPAALVYERLAVLARCEEITVPFVGVEDGLLADLVDELTSAANHIDQQERTVRAAALALGRRYAFDEAHAARVAEISLQIFDQTGDLHGLGVAERRLLLASALLHDIGQFVSFKGHHKHSLYLLQNSELAGFTPAQMRCVANIARYHRKTEPSLSHWAYAALVPRERGVVDRLAAILRVADALDREHLQRVDNVEAKVAGKELELKLHGKGDLMLERWALQSKSGLFSGVFGLKVRVRD